MFTFCFDLPTRIIFCENGFRENLGLEAARFGRRALIVTGRSSAKKSGVLELAESALSEKKVEYEIFDKIEPNPTEPTVGKGTDLLKKFKADCIIAIGGGSPIDAAKAIGVVATFGGKASDYFGAGTVPGRILPLIAAPTTAGTGSEVTRYSVISVPGKKQKAVIVSANIAPHVAIVDPILTRSMPQPLTAATGVDALSHAVESLACSFASPMTEMVNLEAASIIAEALPVSANLQGDVEAHCKMSYAALLAGIGINNAGTGIAHGLSLPLTAEYGIPHGVAVGLLLPHVMEFNMPARRREFAALAEAMGECTDGLALAEAAELSVGAVRRLLRDVRFPVSLKEFGVETKTIKQVAKKILAEPIKLANNPRMPTEKDLIDICLKARDTGIAE
ncbi:MAG: iron-containing alcohol dehydrogenase [bacterium]